MWLLSIIFSFPFVCVKHVAQNFLMRIAIQCNALFLLSFDFFFFFFFLRVLDFIYTFKQTFIYDCIIYFPSAK